MTTTVTRNPHRAYDERGREIQAPTIGECHARGETTAALYCEALGCRHHAVISTGQFPDDLPFPDIVTRVRCSECGSKQVSVRIDIAAYYDRLREAGFTVGSMEGPER